MEDSKTYNVLKELKDGKDAQTAAWLSHPTDYTDLVTSVKTAASGAGGTSIGNTLTDLAKTPLYDGAETKMFPAEFVSVEQAADTSYPNYLTTVLQDFALQVAEYAANAAEEQPIIYAPPLPIDTQDSRSLAYCFATCRWLVSIDAYKGSTYDADIARLNAATNCAAMFSGCASLVTLPERWTFNNLSNANSMFDGCLTLTHLHDDFVSQNITTCSNMFQNCTSLVSLPNRVSNVFTLANTTNCRNVFRFCTKLPSLPDGFDIGASSSYLQAFYHCETINVFPSSLTFKMSRINNAQSQGEYSTDSNYNAMYQMFNYIGFDDYADKTSKCIKNLFTIDPTAQGYTGGIKFDLILWHFGFQKLSPKSVSSLLHCLYDYATYDQTYTNRIPSGCNNGGRAKPTVIVTVAIEDALVELFMEEYGLDVYDYLDGLGWDIQGV